MSSFGDTPKSKQYINIVNEYVDEFDDEEAFMFYDLGASGL